MRGRQGRRNYFNFFELLSIQKGKNVHAKYWSVLAYGNDWPLGDESAWAMGCADAERQGLLELESQSRW